MSLQAFNNMDLNGATHNESPECDMNEKFYADVDEATKIAMNREQIRESLEQRYSVSQKSTKSCHRKAITKKLWKS